jgi:hypothetical protein
MSVIQRWRNLGKYHAHKDGLIYNRSFLFYNYQNQHAYLQEEDIRSSQILTQLTIDLDEYEMDNETT